MRRIRQVLQMHLGARTSARVIAREVGVGRNVVQDFVARATWAKLGEAGLAAAGRADG
jgi:hypothetical protein